MFDWLLQFLNWFNPDSGSLWGLRSTNAPFPVKFSMIIYTLITTFWIVLRCNWDPRWQKGHWRSKISSGCVPRVQEVTSSLSVCGVFCVQLHGTLRVVMEPLLGDMPLIGALSVFFLKKPVSTLTFDPPPKLWVPDIPPAIFFWQTWIIINTCWLQVLLYCVVWSKYRELFSFLTAVFLL